MKRGTGGQKIAEYIEREAAFEAITDLAGKAPTRSAYEAVWKSARALKKVPATDVVPVVHGEWVRPHWRNSNFCYDCSVCGNEVMHQEYRWRDKKIYPICPWCGAKMRENNEI